MQSESAASAACACDWAMMLCWLELALLHPHPIALRGQFCYNSFAVIGRLRFLLGFFCSYFGYHIDMAGMGAQTHDNAHHIAKMDARFHALLAALNIGENSMGRMAE